LKHGLSREGFAVDVAADAEEALKLSGHIPYDALLLNGKFPDRTAYGLLDALHRQRCSAAILMLSDTSDSSVNGHAVPENIDISRMRPLLTDITGHLYAAIERARMLEKSAGNAHELKSGDLRMNLDAHRVVCRGQEIDLTKKEFELLECLMRHPGRVLSQHAISQEMWDIDFDGHSNVVETHVKRLRAKLGDHVPAHIIQTIRGVGYRLAA
jgi:two-component system copper resistance phosphate regulon response regulator CusR